MDRKRINGPETSVIPLPLQEQESIESESGFLGKDGKRWDGRKLEDVRPLFMKTGFNSQADGSAFIEMGNLKILCTVYGPRPDRKLTDPDKGRLNVEYRVAPFADVKKRSYIKDAEEMEFSQVILSALLPAVRLECFPKATVDIFITILERDGLNASVAGAITGASLALADAGIEMYDLVSASTSGFIEDGIMMDLTLKEEKHQKGSLLIAYMTNLNQISQMIQMGELDAETSEEAMDFCIDACAEMYTLMSECLVASEKTQKQSPL